MRGALLYGSGRTEEADKVLGQAVILDPSDMMLTKYHARVRLKHIAEKMRKEEQTNENEV